MPTTAASLDTCLPYRVSPRDEIFSSPKKVFAHYFSRFPLSIDNRPSTEDYYATQYLSPNGEKDKWLKQGGYLRSRPLPTPVIEGAGSYVLENLKKEVRLAMSRGICGFTFDILSLKDIEPDGALNNMIRAAIAVDPRFKLILMPDMSALGPNVDKVVKIITSLYKTAGLFHTNDGRLVVSPFLSESVSPGEWMRMKEQLSNMGEKIAFVPTFLSLKPEYIDKYNEESDGLGVFGTPLPGQNNRVAADSETLHAAHKTNMAGISGQGYRPKSFLFWESEGSLAYRNSWLNAISGGADWIQLTTWNDFSESTEIEPYTDSENSSGVGYFDLTGYYTSWFITGHAPTIIRDALYYFYRKEPVNAAAPREQKATVPAPGTGPGKDLIELVAFLTAPGTLSISIGQHEHSFEVPAGLQAVHVPLEEGVPRFSLTRKQKSTISFEGTTPIAGKTGLSSGFADLTYWSGGACH